MPPENAPPERTELLKNPILSTTSGRLAGLFTVGAVAFLAFLSVIWYENNHLLEQLYDQIGEAKTFNERTILDLDKKSLNEILVSYTTWDDMVDYANKPNVKFEKSNLQDDLFVKLTNICWVFDAKRRLVYHGVSPGNPKWREFKPDRKAIERLAVRRTASRSFSWVNGELVEYIVAGIYPTLDSNRVTPQRGVIATVRIWNKERLRELQSQLHAKVSLQRGLGNETATAAERERGTLVTTHRLQDYLGKTVAVLRTEVTRDSLVELRRSSLLRFVYVASAAFLSLLVFSLLIYRWVQRPLGMLRRSLEIDQPEPIVRLTRETSDFAMVARALVDHFTQRETLKGELRNRERIEAELRLASEAAEQGSRAKSAFLATMSHEIRTPMNGVLGMSQLLLQELTEPKSKGYAQAIQSSAESLLRTLNEVLDFSQIEAQKVSLAEEDFLVRLLIEDTCRLFAATANQKGIELVSDVSPEMPGKIIGDSLRLRQVFMNLVGNAVKFTSEGEVVVRVWPTLLDEGQIRIDFAISDTGIGIDQSRLEKVFEMFTQADRNTSARFGGTGLGLSIARSLCQLMGGDLTATSTPGMGSTFSGWIIGKQSEFVGVDRSGIPPQVGAVLEDNRAGRAALVRLLRSFNWSVDEALDPDRRYDFIFANGAALDPGGVVGIKSTSPETKIILLRNLADPTPSTWLPDGELLEPLRWWELANLVGIIEPVTPVDTEAEEARLRVLAGVRVLVVEDTLVNQIFAETLLEGWGCLPTIVGTGVEAIAVATNFDVVLMDLTLPDMSGLEATRQIREQEIDTHVPIIAITANVSEKDQEECLAAGMDSFLGKPFRADQLADAVAAAVR